MTQSHGMPCFMDSYGIASTRVIDFMAYSRMSSATGAKAEAAVTNRDRGDPVPARQGAVRIPEDLCVVVRVQVHETPALCAFRTRR